MTDNRSPTIATNASSSVGISPRSMPLADGGPGWAPATPAPHAFPIGTRCGVATITGPCASKVVSVPGSSHAQHVADLTAAGWRFHEGDGWGDDPGSWRCPDDHMFGYFLHGIRPQPLDEMDRTILLGEVLEQMCRHGWRVVVDTGAEATVQRPRWWLPAPWHAVLIVVTCGLWAPVLALTYSRWTRRITWQLSIDTEGVLRIVRNPEGR